MADWTQKFSPGASVTYVAGAAITGGNVVYLSAAGTATATAGASAVVLGVASRDVATGELVEVLRGGVQRAVSAAAITVGQPLKSAASGRVTPMTIGTDPQDQYIGFALTAAGAAGTTVDVQWVK
jgi:predicted RecA/RadA family phage recombinase